MPSVASLDALHRAIAEFVVIDLDLVIEPQALAAALRSLDSAGLLLLGEIHGVRENPLLIRALMKAFGLTSLALEWPEDLTPVIRAFLAGGTLADHPWLWGGDGRITAGHMAVLADRAAAGPLELFLVPPLVFGQHKHRVRRAHPSGGGHDTGYRGTISLDRTLQVTGQVQFVTTPPPQTFSHSGDCLRSAQSSGNGTSFTEVCNAAPISLAA